MADIANTETRSVRGPLVANCGINSSRSISADLEMGSVIITLMLAQAFIKW